MKDIIKSVLKKIGWQVQKINPDNPNPIRLWNIDPYFNSVFQLVREFTLVDKTRCFILYQLAKQSNYIQGDIAEIGVYKGGTAKLLSSVAAENGKAIHLFDTFSGMPPVDSERDLHQKGDFSDTSLDNVKGYLSNFKNLNFYKGFFPETSGPIKDKMFSLVHIDVDIYKSVLDCCLFFYPRMNKGGIMIFDDYGFISCPGAKNAVDEFFHGKPECPCYIPTGQCFVIKL